MEVACGFIGVGAYLAYKLAEAHGKMAYRRHQFKDERFLKHFITRKKCRFNYDVEASLMASGFADARQFAISSGYAGTSQLTNDAQKKEFKEDLLNAVKDKMKSQEIETNYIWASNCVVACKRFMTALVFSRYLHMLLGGKAWYSAQLIVDVLVAAMPDLDVEHFRRVNGITNSSKKAVVTYQNTWTKLLRK